MEIGPGPRKKVRSQDLLYDPLSTVNRSVILKFQRIEFNFAFLSVCPLHPVSKTMARGDKQSLRSGSQLCPRFPVQSELGSAFYF